MIGRWLGAVRGGLSFLTRLPVRSREGDWDALRETPGVFPVVGFIAGAITAAPLLASGTVPEPTVAVAYLLAVYGVTGIHHLDGVADLGDAVVVHGDRERRREVLTDTTTGVGALLAVVVVVVGLALGGLGLAGVPIAVAVAIVVAAEVGAKLAMAAMVTLDTAAYEGMAKQFTDPVGQRSILAPIAVSLPAAMLAWPHLAAAIALVSAVGSAALPWYWADRHLGGLSGDIVGAANEIGRVGGVHAGVIAWTLL